MSKKNLLLSIFLLLCCMIVVILLHNIKDEDNEVNINPYFFPDNIMQTEEGIRFQVKTEGREVLDIAKLYVYEEKVFDDGTLYNIVVKYDTDQGCIDLGCFYVRNDKIYLIQDIKLDTALSERGLTEKGIVICQPEPQKEDWMERGKKGWHEDIRIVDDRCIFQRYNDLKESEYDGNYEYFTWEKGKGLTEYRRGHGESEEICLQMKRTEEVNSTEEERINPYFFPSGKTTIKYEGYLHFKNNDPEENKMNGEVIYTGEVSLNIREEKVFEKGILYSMYLSENEEFCIDSSDWGEKNRGYLNLGYFYVQEDKIYKLYLNYFMPERELEDDVTEEELLESGEGKIVCQSEPRHVGEGEDVWPRYWYDYIEIVGDRCEFYGEESCMKTFTESFKWQKGLGLVEYCRGTGYSDDDIIIYFY